MLLAMGTYLLDTGADFCSTASLSGRVPSHRLAILEIIDDISFELNKRKKFKILTNPVAAIHLNEEGLQDLQFDQYNNVGTLTWKPCRLAGTTK